MSEDVISKSEALKDTLGFADYLGREGYTFYADNFWHKVGIYPSIRKLPDIYADYKLSIKQSRTKT